MNLIMIPFIFVIPENAPIKVQDNIVFGRLFVLYHIWYEILRQNEAEQWMKILSKLTRKVCHDVFLILQSFLIFNRLFLSLDGFILWCIFLCAESAFVISLILHFSVESATTTNVRWDAVNPKSGMEVTYSLFLGESTVAAVLWF